jgi:hypothetical protein
VLLLASDNIIQHVLSKLLGMMLYRVQSLLLLSFRRDAQAVAFWPFDGQCFAALDATFVMI